MPKAKKKGDKQKKKGLKSSSSLAKKGDGAITVKSGSIRIIQSSNAVGTENAPPAKKSLGELVYQLKHSHIPSVLSGVLGEIAECISESEENQAQSYHRVINESLSLIMDNNENVRKAASNVVSVVIENSERVDGDRIIAYVIACLTHLKLEIRKTGIKIIQCLIEHQSSVLHGYKSRLLPILLKLCLKHTQTVGGSSSSSLQSLSTASSSSSATANPRKRTKEMNAKTEELLELLTLLSHLCSILLVPLDERNIVVSSVEYPWCASLDQSPLSNVSSRWTLSSNASNSFNTTKRLFQSLDMQTSSGVSDSKERIALKFADTVSSKNGLETDFFYSESQVLHDLVKMLISVWIESCEPLFTLPRIQPTSLFSICYTILSLLETFSTYSRSMDTSFSEDVFGHDLQAVWEKQFTPWFPFANNIERTDPNVQNKLVEMNTIYCQLTLLHFSNTGNQKHRIILYLRNLFNGNENVSFTASQIEQIHALLQYLLPQLSGEDKILSEFAEVLVEYQIDCNSRSVAKSLFSLMAELIESKLLTANDTLIEWISTLSEQVHLLGNKDSEFSVSILSFLIKLAMGALKLENVSSPQDVNSVINVSDLLESGFTKADPLIQQHVLILLHYLPVRWEESQIQALLDICHDSKVSSSWVIGLVDSMISRQNDPATSLDEALVSSFILSCLLGQRFTKIQAYAVSESTETDLFSKQEAERLSDIAISLTTGPSVVYLSWSQERIRDVLRLGTLPQATKSVLKMLVEGLRMPLVEQERVILS